MFGVEGCCWAARGSGANRMSESRVDGRLLGMRDLSSEDVRCRQAARRGALRDGGFRGRSDSQSDEGW